MGLLRSSSTSCFKIMTCGSDSATDNDELKSPENKASSDKRGWSFRKRSTTHRVLSNTVISETPSSGIKEIPESAPANFQTQPNSITPEKTPSIQWIDEKPRSGNLRLSELLVATVDDRKVDVGLDESVIVVIQTAIRGFLARSELLKQDSIVKLQAAVRGYLVRRHAVGTLRCVQAIMRMQGLVRARHARRSREGASTEEKLNEKHGKDNHSSKFLEEENSGIKTYNSIEKLLSNSFARQLIESTPKTKSINIKCDPSKSDSAWKWLERWMSVSSVESVHSQKSHSSTEPQELEKVQHSEIVVGNLIPSDTCCNLTDSRTSLEKAAVPFESEENLITYDADRLSFHACQATSESLSLEKPQSESTGTSNSSENSLGLFPSQTKQSDSISNMEHSALSGNRGMEYEHFKRGTKRSDCGQPEIEGKRFVCGSRKASNPAFIAAQSKFEELSLAFNSGKSLSLPSQDSGVESFAESVDSATENALRTAETGSAENSVCHSSMVQVGGSECGTELSISSTLDSPDRLEPGGTKFELAPKLSEDIPKNPKSAKSIDGVVKEESIVQGSDLSYTTLVQLEKCDDINGANGANVSSAISEEASQMEQKTEKNASDMQIDVECETGHQIYNASPVGSPRSHITVPESQGTPSSQVSVNAKKPKVKKSGSKQPPRSSSAGKRSSLNSNQDSGARSSVEKLTKDPKTGKRRDSIGSARPDCVDQAPRDSISSSNSLPNYMQATESVKAKALANSSPRSSPDVLDKEIYLKKRQSLPGANGKQGSPQIQLSPSQAQQSLKGNGSHLHERKWLR